MDDMFIQKCSYLEPYKIIMFVLHLLIVKRD